MTTTQPTRPEQPSQPVPQPYDQARTQDGGEGGGFSYSHDDAGLLRQPIGYWSWAANKAVIDFMRAGLAEVGLSQPQWWVINQVRDGVRSREDVVAMLRGYLDAGDVLQTDIDELIGRGVLTTPQPGRIALTEPGRSLLERATARQRKTLARVHEGVSDAEFLTTMKVLQRMIHNTGGKAWHH